MGLFFNRKKNKKSKKGQGENDVLDLGVLEPLDLTNALVDETPPVEVNADQVVDNDEVAASEVSTSIKPLDLEIDASAKDDNKDNEPSPVVPPIKVESTGDPKRDAMAQQFAELRRAVAQRQVDDRFQPQNQSQPPLESMPLESTEERAPEDVEVKEKARGIFARKKKAPSAVEHDLADFVETEVQVAPEAVVFEPISQEPEQEVVDVEIPAATFGAAKEPSRLRMQMDESWLGLWVAEDGRAIVIEEGDPGDYFVSAMPDPMSKCYTGPDYPEIETWRMPAEFVREPIGEIEGDRVVINTVPGLPEEHKAPSVYLYFLTEDEEEEGENRFAQRGDRLRSVFMVSDSTAGTVNPWGDGDEVLWLGEPASFYKAPEKLDLYIDKRLRKGDPSNFTE